MLQKPPFFTSIFSWIIFSFVWLFAQLPYAVIVFLGKGLGRLVQLLLPSRRKVVVINLDICFPHLNARQKRQLMNQHFKELGIMFTQSVKAFLGLRQKIEQDAIIHGGEHIQACLDKKHGVLLVAGHFTALDVGGKILCKKYPIAGMYRPHKNPVTEYIVTKSRLKYATWMFKRDELRAIVKHLKVGGILWYAPDQDYRRGQSVFVPFFGKPAATITATHQLARLSKCKVLFFHVQRNPQSPHYTLSISAPVENYPSDDVVFDTARINQGIEQMVKRNPAEYLWVHKRFKSTITGEQNPYKKALRKKN